MAKTLGYMLSWTTYGTWLQGDDRGYTDRGVVLRENQAIENANLQHLKKEAVHLNESQQSVVVEAIRKEAESKGQRIFAVAVCSDHVHIMGGYVEIPLAKLLWAYKFATARALHKTGIVGKVWTKGYDKRFCFDTDSLTGRIEYVKRHRGIVWVNT